MKPPEIEKKAICIAKDSNFGAVISSYFNNSNTYFSIFYFPDMSASYKDEVSFNEDNFLSNMIGHEAGVLINNVIARLKPNYVILAGLDDKQKSFFYFIPSRIRIDIDCREEIEEKLKFLNKSFNGELRCNKENILNNLIKAKRTNKKLIFDENSTGVDSGNEDDTKDNIVVIEDKDDIFSVIAINYAFAVGAEVFLVKSTSKEEIYDTQKNIYKWKKEGDDDAYKNIEKKVNDRVSYIDFSKYKCATFFTEGLPYSLILKNIIPVSYVWRGHREDFFIFNSIFFEHFDSFDSAIVFSPEEFSDEETQNVIEKLKTNKFFVKELTNVNATVNNFGNYVEHYPYDILHICSHGGETDGYYLIEKFKDRKGLEHTVEYEEIVGFAPVPGKDLIAVHRKAIFRKFDGYKWMSPELKTQGIPKYVFEDMRKNLFSGDMGEKALRTKINYPIINSCHIKCYDSIHQGMFRVLASHNSPIVFNNTCVSWYEIASFFIYGGCRGYIGTLWNIKNYIAKNAAIKFYDNFLNGTVLQTFFKMSKQIKDSKDSDIYIYWGLPFTRIKPPQKPGRGKVLEELLSSSFRWFLKIKSTKSSEVKKNSVDILKFVAEEVMNNFGKDDVKSLEEKYLKEYPELFKKYKRDQKTDKDGDFLERGVMDLSD